MTTISPSILSADFMNLEHELSFIKDVKDIWLHLDVMDGHFVPNLTFGAPIIKQLSSITNIPLDVHLMVTNPSFHVNELRDHGVHNLTFHIEVEQEPEKILKIARPHYKSIGISIKPKTKVCEITIETLSLCDLILVMSVEPGFGGQSFMPNSLEKIKELIKLREEHSLNFKIQIDGGINLKTSKDAIAAGADNLVAGSYIFKEDQSKYTKQIEELR